ncbi:hypothetical protein MNEG_3572, partial [Monoraphidium neglectum]
MPQQQEQQQQQQQQPEQQQPAEQRQAQQAQQGSPGGTAHKRPTSAPHPALPR